MVDMAPFSFANLKRSAMKASKTRAEESDVNVPYTGPFLSCDENKKNSLAADNANIAANKRPYLRLGTIEDGPDNDDLQFLVGKVITGWEPKLMVPIKYHSYCILLAVEGEGPIVIYPSGPMFSRDVVFDAQLHSEVPGSRLPPEVPGVQVQSEEPGSQLHTEEPGVEIHSEVPGDQLHSEAPGAQLCPAVFGAPQPLRIRPRRIVEAKWSFGKFWFQDGRDRSYNVVRTLGIRFEGCDKFGYFWSEFVDDGKLYCSEPLTKAGAIQILPSEYKSWCQSTRNHSHLEDWAFRRQLHELNPNTAAWD
ncbi:hypothetical protein TWF718_009899 [Orbilia javanica]|uniref:Uncharacterized protein n=1 Tax=Orbilia javanica TaxID=47235 RepID=A0AAN8MKV2_9PEZI